ncbi:MAG: patatin-like phospholipase family protein [Parvularculaceae bacterium]
MAAHKKKINVALQGGGAHGAITWGVLDRLLEDERLDIEAVSGASAGAVNAVALAYGLHLGKAEGAREKLAELWRAISDVGAFYNPMRRMPWEQAAFQSSDNSVAYQMFDLVTRTFSPYQFNPFDINPLKTVLVRCIDFAELRKCDRYKTFLSATNVRSGKIKVFETPELTAEVVLASACLPMLFKAVEIGGEHYWDGGFMGNPALFPFFYKSESKDVVIVHVTPIDRAELPTTAPEILNRMNEISFNSSLIGELRAISFVHRLLDQGLLKDEHRKSFRSSRIHSIRSDDALEDLSVASKYDIDFGFLSGLKERGRAVADAWLSETFDRLGVESSIDIRKLYDGGAG